MNIDNKTIQMIGNKRSISLHVENGMYVDSGLLESIEWKPLSDIPKNWHVFFWMGNDLIIIEDKDYEPDAADGVSPLH